jgi:hypothetical protein
MRIIYTLVVVLLTIGTYAVPTLAQDETSEVRYACNTNTGVIEIHLSEFDESLEGKRNIWQGKAVPWGQAQKIETIKDVSLGERYFRKSGKPVRYECDLKSGKYIVTFGAHWVNSNLDGQDGADSWPTVKITRGKETVLPITVLGVCDTGRSTLGNCRNKWAIRVFLIHSGDKPSVTVDRFVKDWVR